MEISTPAVYKNKWMKLNDVKINEFLAHSK